MASTSKPIAKQKDSSSTKHSKAADSASPKASSVSAASASTGSCGRVPLPVIIGGVGGCAGLGIGLATWLLLRGRRRKGEGGKGQAQGGGPGPCAKLKPSCRCVALADGSGCVIRREIAADNSCLFNSIGYAMHKSKTRAPHLRNVVAQQVSGDKTTYSDVFLGMTNEAYCNWIRQSHTWGGGIELSILAQAYGIEIAAWNIESCKEHVFGEESGYKRQVMVVYNGVHYDALAVATSPRAKPDDDDTSYNPRTKRGKMIIAAARKLVELAHRQSQFYGASSKKTAASAAIPAASAASKSSSTASLSKAAKANGGTPTTATAAPDGGEATTITSKPAAKSGRVGTQRRIPRGTATANTKADGGAAAATKAAPHGGPAEGGSTAAGASAVGSSAKLSCGDCGVALVGPAAAAAHADATGHQNFAEVA